MIKTDQPGFETDGRGTVVNTDLRAYHELRGRMKEMRERDELKDEVAQLRSLVTDIHGKVVALMEKIK